MNRDWESIILAIVSLAVTAVWVRVLWQMISFAASRL